MAQSHFGQGCFILLLIDGKKWVGTMPLFHIVYIMVNTWNNIVDAFDRPCEPPSFMMELLNHAYIHWEA